MGVYSLAKSSIKNWAKYPTMMAGSTELSSDHLITETVLASAAASVTFDVTTLAAQGYKHLQLRYVAKSGTGTGTAGDMRFNSDTGANYRTHILTGNGSSVSSGYYGGVGIAAEAVVDIFDISPSTSNGWTVGVADILDFSSTSKNKTVRRLGGRVANDISITTIELLSSVWLSTAAITEISLYARSQNLAAGSRFSLYASKG